MSNIKISNTIFVMVFMFVISLLLGFMGIYAINSYFRTQNRIDFSPYIVCAIDYSIDNVNWINIYDNYNSKEYIDNAFVKQFSATDVSIKTVLESLSYDDEDNQVRTKMYLRVTNYSPNKHIQGRITECKINNERITDLNYTTSRCQPYLSGENVGDAIEVELPIVIIDSTVTYSFNIEEMFEVKFENSRNILNENYYTSSGENAVINLQTNEEGAIMPNDVIVKSGDTTLTKNTQYIYDEENKKITIYYAFIKGDIDITCLVNQTYKINEYLDGDVKPICESALGNTTYNYYVELGEYPQSYVGDTDNVHLEYLYHDGNLRTGLTEVTGTNTYTLTIGASSVVDGIQWFVYNNDKYVRSYTIACSETLKFSDFGGGSIIGDTASYKWYKVEPIRWVVIDTVGSELELNELYYDNYRLYADITHLTPYTDGLLLISELALDTACYDSVSSFLNEGNFATSSGLINYFSNNENSIVPLISNQTLHTQNYVPSSVESSAYIFTLGYDDSSTYNQAEYFGETISLTNNLGLASPSDYALGHYVFADEEQDPPYRAYTTKSNARTLTTSYWLRSANISLNEDMADIINSSGTPFSEFINATYIGVRPALVFNPPHS